MTISKTDIPIWVNWIAQDASGIWWGYSVEPLRFDKGWYENEIGNSVRLSQSDAANWKHSLKKLL